MKLFNWLQETDGEGDPSAESSDDKPLSPLLQSRLQELRKMSVKEAMIPRALVTALDADVQLRRVRRLKSAKVIYFPVYKGDLDHILGWIPKSKVLELMSNEPNEEVRLADHVKSVGVVPETATVADLADAFLKEASPFLVVKNDQDATVGIVPLGEFVELVFGFELTPAAQNSASDITVLRGYEL
jgi:CBS domain containing-hemolysin-like protein